MKNNILLVLILSVIFTGCFSSNNSNSEVKLVDDIDRPLIEEVAEGEELEFIGTYDSKTGVMTDISCYCFQTGYFTTEEGDKIVICFEDGTEEVPCSENLRIVGYYENVKITPEYTSPCAAGEREVFHVTEYECL